MIDELWRAFPRNLEQKINALLDGAEPSPTKAFHLYKTCQGENLWSDSFEKFSRHLTDFFALPKYERHKSDLDSFLERPLSSHLYEDFHLNFHNALVDNRSVMNLVSWAHHMIRVGYKTESVVISSDVLGRALNTLIHPPLFEKALDLEFADFCSAWQKVVFKLFGGKYDTELNEILKELNRLNTQLQIAEENPAEAFVPGIYLTQTEIDWTLAVRQAVLAKLAAPKFPLSRGVDKPRLIDLEKALKLYQIVQTTKLPELLRHRENIRTTILSQCEGLLRDKAR